MGWPAKHHSEIDLLSIIWVMVLAKGKSESQEDMCLSLMVYLENEEQLCLCFNIDIPSGGHIQN